MLVLTTLLKLLLFILVDIAKTNVDYHEVSARCLMYVHVYLFVSFGWAGLRCCGAYLFVREFWIDAL